MKQEVIKKEEFIRLNELHDKGRWTYEELIDLANLYKKFYITIIKTDLPNIVLGKLLKFKIPEQKKFF